MLAVLFFLVAGVSSAAAQDTGAIAGVVVDAANGETLPGANVSIKGTTTGISTDLKGRYRITGLEPGSYDVLFSFVGFTQKTVTGVEVEAGETVKIDVSLQEQTAQMDEVVISAAAARDTDAGLLNQRAKAAAVSNAISAEAIGRAGAGTAADAVSKVTGASLVGGRYVNIRGLQGRYVDTQLNGSNLPSTDPEGNSVALDIFPSNIIDNIVTTKSFTPDRPGNFTGGSVNISTKSFPEDRFFEASFSSSSNSEMGIGGTVLLPDGGLDAIPAVAQREDLPQSIGQVRFDDAKATLLDQATRAFAAPMAPRQRDILTDYSGEVAFGDQFRVLGDRPLGVLASLSYNQSFSGYDDGVSARFEQRGLEDEELNPTAQFTSQGGTEETLLGGLAGLNFQLAPQHEIGLRFLYSEDDEETARIETGQLSRDLTGDQVFVSQVLETIERTMTSTELNGTHRFGGGRDGVRVEWDASYSTANREEPDRRLFNYSFEERNGGADTLFSISPSIYKVPTRFFRDLSEDDLSGRISVGVPVGPARLKAGGSYKARSRDFRETQFEIRADQASFSGNQNVYANEQAGLIGTDEQGRNQFGTVVRKVIQPSNNYDGDQDVGAGFLMVETPVPGLPSLEFIGGVRVEHTDMSVATIEEDPQRGEFTETDLLPSGNLVWAARDNMNVRLAYGRTIARPSFREFAPFDNFNFVGDFIEIGNPDLTRTLTDNVDLRWEWFPRAGEVLSASVFYKQFDDPIERVINPEASGANVELTYENKDEATVYGVELEANKRLDGVASWLQHVEVGGNVTFIQSEVDRSERELEAIRSFDEDPSTTRPLQGQSPFLFNLNAGYENPNSGTSINVLFNRFGDRLDTVTRNGLDIYEEGRSTLDVTAAQGLGYGVKVKGSVKNVLDSDRVEAQSFRGQDFVNIRRPLGRTVSLGVSYSF